MMLYSLLVNMWLGAFLVYWDVASCGPSDSDAVNAVASNGCATAVTTAAAQQQCQKSPKNIPFHLTAPFRGCMNRLFSFSNDLSSIHVNHKFFLSGVLSPLFLNSWFLIATSLKNNASSKIISQLVNICKQKMWDCDTYFSLNNVIISILQFVYRNYYSLCAFFLASS